MMKRVRPMKDHDGRRFRSERTHKALIDACVAIMQQARIPTTADVAKQAGCSARTVFWHFTTLASLQEAALGIILRRAGIVSRGEQPSL